MTWPRRLRSVLIWTAATEAPRGVIAALVSLWTVAFMSLLVWEVTMRVFGDTPPQITAGTATAYAALLGTGLAGAWAFFQWARARTGAGP